MGSVIWLLILLCLAGILVSLGAGLFQLSRGTEEGSRRLLRALTVRITLSIALFALLIIAWRLGLIAPHTFGGGALPPP